MGRPDAVRRSVTRWALAVRLATAALAPTAGAALAGDPYVPAQTSTSSPPACRVADVTTRNRGPSQWAYTLLDWTYRVPGAYRPPTLVPVTRAGLLGAGSVRGELIPDLRAMATAARAAGAAIAVDNAYRSSRAQASMFAALRDRIGHRAALLQAARPGHSEHQLGTTIDVRARSGATPFASTRAGRWTAANAWRYGFVLSYPAGARSTVCYGSEPWHFRYYGRPVAAAMHRSGLTPRVWLWRHGNDPAGPGPRPAAP